MKTNHPTVRLVLRTNKTLANSSHPIMLRVQWKGLKEKSTKYSCSSKDWDKTRECIKKSAPNSGAINMDLIRQKNVIIERIAYLEALGEDFTLDDIFSNKSGKKGLKTPYSDVMIEYFCARQLAYTTTLSHKVTSNALDKFFGRTTLLEDLSEESMRRFAASLNIGDGSIRQKLGEVGAVCAYAIEKGMMPKDRHPFSKWVFTKKYKPAHKELYIDHNTMKFVKDYVEQVMDETPPERLYNGLYSKPFAILLYYSMFLFQGLALIDLSKIKKRDLRVINGFYSVDMKRSKTRVNVKIRIKKSGIAERIIEGFLENSKGEYLFPMFNNCEIHPNERARNVCKYVNNHLRSHWVAINDKIKANQMLTCPLIDTRCTLYSARHTYAFAYMANGGSPLALATLMGRSVNTLATYVAHLSQELDLENAVSIMDDSVGSST